MQEARGDCLTGAMAPKTWNQGREVLGSPIAWLCLPLARPSWKGGAGASSSPLAQQAQGAQPGGCVGSGGEAGEPLRPAPTVGSRLRGDGPHFLPGRRLPLVLNSQGLQTLFLIPQPLAS